MKRVETDTRIVLYNYVTASVESGTTYEIKKDSPLGFQFYTNADDYRILHYAYLAKAYDLQNENYDSILLPDEFAEVICTRAESMKKKDDKDPTWPTVVQLYQAELDGQKMHKHVVNPRYGQFAPKIHSSMPGRG